MVPFIATISEPALPGIKFIEEYRVIVLAQHEYATEQAIHAYIAKVHEGSEYNLSFEKAWASPDYLKVANLKPDEVKRFAP